MLFQEELDISTYRGIRKLTRNNLLAKYTTDIQAEVLVKDFIPSKSILNVCFENEEQLAMTKAAMSSFNTNNFIVDTELFNFN